MEIQISSATRDIAAGVAVTLLRALPSCPAAIAVMAGMSPHSDCHDFLRRLRSCTPAIAMITCGDCRRLVCGVSVVLVIWERWRYACALCMS